MGKKNKGGTGSEAFDYSFGVGEAKSLMKRYGIEGASMGNPRMGGTQRSVKDVKKDIAAAMMNDYDTRRTLEASAMAGNKDAKKFAKKGIKAGKIQDAYGVMRDLKETLVVAVWTVLKTVLASPTLLSKLTVMLRLKPMTSSTPVKSSLTTNLKN